jgi:hypothetical protein
MQMTTLAVVAVVVKAGALSCCSCGGSYCERLPGSIFRKKKKKKKKKKKRRRRQRQVRGREMATLAVAVIPSTLHASDCVNTRLCCGKRWPTH